MKSRTQKALRITLWELLLLLPLHTLFQPVRAQASQETPGVQAGLRSAAEMEGFVDGIIAAQREALHIAGVVVAVVADGQLFFAKGYGPADGERGIQSDPARSLFRIGSVSKLFTWTAVMQLVEQGKIRLDADVNTYLRQFKVPATYPEPITMTHLLTHTAGFEDQVIGLFAREPGGLRPLGALLADEMPDRVRPPGLLSSYSNHGTALAGFIVQEVSGLPWEDYIEKNILQPLAMNHTTVRQPLPKEIAGDMAAGYKYGGGEFKPQTFEYVPAMPAGSMSAAANDMANFMIAHLQEGRFGSIRILGEATARTMHSRLFSQSPRLNGMLHGFYEMNRNGERIYGHGGDTIWFHTQMALFPDRNLGLFVSYNSDTGAKARSDFVKTFIDHYFPPPEAPAPKPPAGFRQRADRFAGQYSSVRRSYTSMAKIAALLGAVKVEVDSSGFLVTRGLGGERQKWVEIEPLTFREVKTRDTLLFHEDKDGRITAAFLGSAPFLSFVRLAPTETPGFHFALLGLSSVLLASAAIAWPIAAYRRRRRIAFTREARTARIVAWFAAIVLLAFLVILAVLLANPMEIAFGVPASLRIALFLPLLALPLTAVVIVMAALAWIRSYWWAIGRIHYLLVACACAALLWWCWYWNLLGYHFN